MKYIVILESDGCPLKQPEKFMEIRYADVPPKPGQEERTGTCTSRYGSGTSDCTEDCDGELYNMMAAAEPYSQRRARELSLAFVNRGTKVTVTDVRKLGEQMKDGCSYALRARPLLELFYTGATKMVRVENYVCKAAKRELKEIFRHDPNYYVRQAAGEELSYPGLYIELRLSFFPEWF